ncbi:ABC-type Fe3+-hydroxamate transport system, periplasmic component [Winogradskyella psychrotolerans RS-3]|uniref:ABC-type Fe3+-hydroxamate transport system, periplasmic component n=1 Tax=Winogradskyella psychrotolerans RS-3 TaxID=641526 RepID=S7XCZ9_9FLAO|nr:helical backbone metal receptor [Winogradskyella psychrotolerans]EPR73878.1 ABC-type Fe3+-hydroxamate transport system, periplasmic component [Winogradskyella psychrotolerans RS-3]
MKDQLKREIQLKKTPKRIISLVPSQTELLVDLGLESSIFGVTKFCVHPKHLRMSKAVVGGTKQINIEKIIALRPDIILCNKEENTKEMIESLEEIAPIHVSDIYNLDDCFELINMYGEIFDIKRTTSTLVANIQLEREAFQLQFQNTDKLKIAYFIWKKPWMVAASDNFIDVMITEAGFVNVFNDEKRYPEVDLSNPKLKEADIIFLSSEPFPFKEEHVLKLKAQFPKKTIKIVDGELFSWYGSRLLKSYLYFQTLHN